jgi:MFS family permease
MTNDLKNPQLRARQYFYVDGTFEFGFGLLSLLLAGYFFVETHVHGWLSAIVDVSLVLVMISGGFLVNLLTRKLKERVTYPRTGYISYRQDKQPKRVRRAMISIVIGGLVAALATVLVAAPHRPNLAVMPIFSGILFGLVLAIVAWRTAILRFYLLALLSAAVGIALSFSGLEDYPGLVAYYAATAVLLLFTGACVLRSYLRKNPVPPQEEAK